MRSRGSFQFRASYKLGRSQLDISPCRRFLPIGGRMSPARLAAAVAYLTSMTAAGELTIDTANLADEFLQYNRVRAPSIMHGEF